MSDLTIRTGLKTLLEAVQGTGKIHDYERFSADVAKFFDLFKDAISGKIFGWEITRERVRVERIAQKYKATYSYAIKGYYGLKDSEATEKTFNAVIALIIQKLIDTKISGTQGQSLPQVDNISARMFGGILCHYSEIKLDVSEILEKTPEAGVVDLLAVGLDYYLKPGDAISDAADEVTLEQ